MNKNHRTFQLNLSNRWQQSSIRTKLLLPIMVGLGLAVIAILIGIQPPINTLADKAVQESFTRHTELLEDRSVALLGELQSAITDLSANNTVTDSASQLAAAGNNSETRTKLIDSITGL